MAKDLAIVLNNGSINSAVVTAMASQRYRPVMIFADFTQGDTGRKRAAYDQQVAHFKPYREYSVADRAGWRSGPAQNLAAVADPRQGSTVAPQMLDLLAIARGGDSLGGASSGGGDLFRAARWAGYG